MAAGSPQDVARQIEQAMNRASTALKGATQTALTEAGRTAKKELESAARPVTGGDLRFSNMGGARLSVSARRKGTDVIEIAPKGPWGMVQPGAKPHAITPKGRSRRLRIGNDFVSGAVRHPGTRDRRTWDKGHRQTLVRLERELPDRIGDAVEEAFGG